MDAASYGSSGGYADPAICEGPKVWGTLYDPIIKAVLICASGYFIDLTFLHKLCHSCPGKSLLGYNVANDDRSSVVSLVKWMLCMQMTVLTRVAPGYARF